MKGQLASLTGLRGVAALWVLAYHTMTQLRHFDPDVARMVGVFGAAGYLGVDLFFVLSGFVIAYTYAGTTAWTPRVYGAFLWKRLARIYPMHLAGLALFGALILLAPAQASVSGHSIAGLIGSITLTHAWSIPVTGTWNVPSWSVSLEWAAYLAFPLIAAAAMRRRSAKAIVGWILLLFTGLLLAALLLSFRGTMAYGVLRIAAEFTSGVLLYRLWSLRHDAMAPVFGIAVLATLVFVGNGLDLVVEKKTAFVHLPIMAAIVVYCLACAPSALAGSAAQHLGRISYSLYVVHWTTLHFAAAVVRSHALAPAWIIAAGAASVAIADICYRGLEQPARAWLLRFAR
jgi:peptidoglycan/LPS O-acetylase OafA/YrhL